MEGVISLISPLICLVADERCWGAGEVFCLLPRVLPKERGNIGEFPFPSWSWQGKVLGCSLDMVWFISLSSLFLDLWLISWFSSLFHQRISLGNKKKRHCEVLQCVPRTQIWSVCMCFASVEFLSVRSYKVTVGYSVLATHADAVLLHPTSLQTETSISSQGHVNPSGFTSLNTSRTIARPPRVPSWRCAWVGYCQALKVT